jgi:hypothetical protein
MFLPIFGFLYFFALWLLGKEIFNKQSKIEVFNDFEELRLADESIRSVDINNEINIVPLEEALAINNNSIKRKMLIDILKCNPIDYVDFLKKVLNDEDSETSHYAATAIVEIKRKLILALQDLAQRQKSDPTDIDVLIAYADTLKIYLDNRFLDEVNYKKLRNLYNELLINLLEIYHAREEYFIDKINCDLEIGDIISAKYYCRKFSNIHTNSEKPYLMYMKLFFSTHDHKGFYESLNALRKSAVNISNNTLNLVRFWSGGGD